MEKTLESIFIKQYEDKQNELDLITKENEKLTQRIKELENTYLNKPLEDEIEDKRKLLQTFKILYRQDVMSQYNYKNLEIKHTLEYFKSLLTDDKKLMRFIKEIRKDSYSKELVMEVKKHEVNHYCQYGNEILYFRIYTYDNHLDSNNYNLNQYFLTEEEAFEKGKKEVVDNIKRHINELEKEQKNE